MSDIMKRIIYGTVPEGYLFDKKKYFAVVWTVSVAVCVVAVCYGLGFGVSSNIMKGVIRFFGGFITVLNLAYSVSLFRMGKKTKGSAAGTFAVIMGIITVMVAVVSFLTGSPVLFVAIEGFLNFIYMTGMQYKRRSDAEHLTAERVLKEAGLVTEEER